MKTVIVNDGDTMQVDLVPENDHDKTVLSLFKDGDTLRVGKASGYAPCMGNYMRQFDRQNERAFVFLTTNLVTDE